MDIWKIERTFKYIISFPYVRGSFSICQGLNFHMSGVKSLYPLAPIPYADSLVSQDDGENFDTEIMGWEQRIWTENLLLGP